MPRAGAITFGDLIGELDLLRVACRKRDRKGYLIECYGRDGRLMDRKEGSHRRMPQAHQK